PARVLGRSPCDDLAVLSVTDPPKEGFSATPLSGDPVNLGTPVLAVGYPVGGESQALTAGIVSRVGEEVATPFALIEDTIQTDAALNPGSSGGPLITRAGEVIGLNFARYDPASLEGVGIAVSSRQVLALLERLQAGENLRWLGLSVWAVGPAEAELEGFPTSGLWVQSVEPGSAVALVGIRSGDFITSIDGLPLATDATVRGFCNALASADLTARRGIEVLRDGVTYEGELNGRRLASVGTVVPASPAGGLADAACAPGTVLHGALDFEGLRLLNAFLRLGAAADVVVDQASRCLGAPSTDSGWYTSTFEAGVYWCHEAELERYLAWESGSGSLALYFVKGGRLAPSQAIFTGFWYTGGTAGGMALTTADGFAPGDSLSSVLARSESAATYEMPWGDTYVSLGPDVVLSAVGPVEGLVAVFSQDDVLTGIGLGPFCGE
ncbi:MAG: S1C family serine protease, partial [Acidimicrobiia bacterium]